MEKIICDNCDRWKKIIIFVLLAIFCIVIVLLAREPMFPRNFDKTSCIMHIDCDTTDYWCPCAKQGGHTVPYEVGNNGWICEIYSEVGDCRSSSSSSSSNSIVSTSIL